jgi:HTH-type transcriptional regulator / antitoxin HipB
MANAMETVMPQTARLPVQLGAIIQSERLRRGMTQQELASLIGKQQKTISAIENGSAGTRLDTLLGVIAQLDLEMQIVSRTRDDKSIEDVF